MLITISLASSSGGTFFLKEQIRNLENPLESQVQLDQELEFVMKVGIAHLKMVHHCSPFWSGSLWQQLTHTIFF